MSSRKPTGLGFVDKSDTCKRRMITAFNREWKSTRNREKAYERALDVLERCIMRIGITNKKAVAGLEAELFYYYINFDSQHLSAESASGMRSDFRGIIRGKPSAIDVTTAPRYKEQDDFLEVKEALGKKWEYYIGVVDLRNRDANLYPLLLPRCEDGNLGHFVLITFETELESLGGRFGGFSDSQILVKYNPLADDDDSALEETVESWDYIITDPAQHYDYLMHEAQYPEIYPTQNLALKDFREFGNGMAFEFKQESGFLISAITTSYYVYDKPTDEGTWETRSYWVHPHPYVRRVLGKPLSCLDHNIAGVAYG